VRSHIEANHRSPDGFNRIYRGGKFVNEKVTSAFPFKTPRILYPFTPEVMTTNMGFGREYCTITLNSDLGWDYDSVTNKFFLNNDVSNMSLECDKDFRTEIDSKLIVPCFKLSPDVHKMFESDEAGGYPEVLYQGRLFKPRDMWNDNTPVHAEAMKYLAAKELEQWKGYNAEIDTDIKELCGQYFTND
jgi:hypothetical protein